MYFKTIIDSSSKKRDIDFDNINFRIPKHLKWEFKTICKLHRVSATGVLVSLIDSFINDHVKEQNAK